MDRLEINRLLRDLYAARVRGDLDGVCRTFSQDAKFRIAGTGHGTSTDISAVGINEIRQWLVLLIKSFLLADHFIESILIDGVEAAVHWRTTVHSRITGVKMPTELVDLVTLREHQIASYTEFFVSR